MAVETWYVLEDNAAADPRDVAPGKDGKLRHKDGRTVAYAPHGPRSRSIDPDAERAKVKPKSRNMKPAEQRHGYSTRDIIPAESKNAETVAAGVASVAEKSKGD